MNMIRFFLLVISSFAGVIFSAGSGRSIPGVVISLESLILLRKEDGDRIPFAPSVSRVFCHTLKDGEDLVAGINNTCRSAHVLGRMVEHIMAAKPGFAGGVSFNLMMVVDPKGMHTRALQEKDMLFFVDGYQKAWKEELKPDSAVLAKLRAGYLAVSVRVFLEATEAKKDDGDDTVGASKIVFKVTEGVITLANGKKETFMLPNLPYKIDRVNPKSTVQSEVTEFFMRNPLMNINIMGGCREIGRVWDEKSIEPEFSWAIVDDACIVSCKVHIKGF